MRTMRDTRNFILDCLESRRLLSADPSSLTIGDTVYTVESTGANEWALFKSNTDGSDKTILRSGWNLQPDALYDFNGKLLSAADWGDDRKVSGRELWVSDGSTDGTVMLKDLCPGARGSDPHDFGLVDGNLVFYAQNWNYFQSIWTTDGTPDGTIELYQPISATTYRTSSDGKSVYFDVSSFSGDEIHRWQTNGTTSGTAIAPGADIVGGKLRVFGSDNADTISITRVSGSSNVKVSIAGQPDQTFGQTSFSAISIYALEGNDKVTVANDVSTPATVLGGTGNDTLVGNSADSLDGGAGDDSINPPAVDPPPIDVPPPVINPVPAPILTKGVLYIGGTTSADTIVVEKDGSDPSVLDVTINGKTTAFTLAKVKSILADPGKGDDSIDLSGTDIVSKIYGGPGNDTIHGSSAADRIYGGAGNDWISGNAGNDTIYGQAGDDRLFGGDGTDYLFGGAGNNTIRGQAGKDRIFANKTDDLRGNAGDVLA